MIVEIVIVEELSFKEVQFYTVFKEGAPVSEFRDFKTRMAGDRKDKKQSGEITRMIEQIGHRGADERYFAREGTAARLPAPTFRFLDSDGETDYGLRLYCIRISNQIVILLNGDRKTAQNPLHCPNCRPHFLFANRVSEAIYDAKLADQISFDGCEILLDDDFKLNIEL